MCEGEYLEYFFKTLFKCDLGKVGGSKNSIKEREDEEERDRLLAQCYATGL